MIAGIGGTFLFSANAERVAAWYARVLGIAIDARPDDGYFGCEFEQREAAGERRLTRCVWAIFQLEPGVEAQPHGVTINYRTDDLDALVARIEGAGVTIARRADYAHGRFAWVDDPEGRHVELWQDTRLAP